MLKPLRHGLARLSFATPPKTVFFAQKQNDPKVNKSAHQLLLHLKNKYALNVVTSAETKQALNLDFLKTYTSFDQFKLYQNEIDLVVSLGGDGTILRAVNMLKHVASPPPVLAFSMGTLGFLLPFAFENHEKVIRNVFEGRALAAKRSRLKVTMPNRQVLRALNEVSFHRGSSPHLTMLDISIDGQHLTTAIADGISISTPTGSTAYSLSAGGSIVHPSVECILITPICPRSLSFRPLVIPQSSKVTVKVSYKTRGGSQLSLDGGNNLTLKRGDMAMMEIDQGEDVWCVTECSDTIDWVGHINELLGFNRGFRASERTSEASE